jgi:hypothetical protein
MIRDTRRPAGCWENGRYNRQAGLLEAALHVCHIALHGVPKGSCATDVWFRCLAHLIDDYGVNTGSVLADICVIEYLDNPRYSGVIHV